MTYKIEIKHSAEKDLRKHMAGPIIDRSEAEWLQKLTATDNTYRIRINDYRVVYSFDRRSKTYDSAYENQAQKRRLRKIELVP